MFIKKKNPHNVLFWRIFSWKWFSFKKISIGFLWSSNFRENAGLIKENIDLSYEFEDFDEENKDIMKENQMIEDNSFK